LATVDLSMSICRLEMGTPSKSHSKSILWDKNHIKIFCSEIWVEMIFGWPTFKIMCNTPIFYQLKMSNWKPGERLQAPGSL
jgi:hypothetical protein